MTTQTEVATLLPLLTPYSLPEGEAGDTLFEYAQARVLKDAPTLQNDDELLTEAICYYLAHVLSLQEGRSGVTSEHLGQWSASYSWAESTPYLSEYKRILNGIAKPALIRASSVQRHSDRHKAECLSLDNTRGDGCCMNAIWERDSREY